jgi:hypothetical protein
MITAHCTIIQEGQAAIFYRHTKQLKGYMIAGTLVGPEMVDKMAFAKLWTHFISDIVRSDDIYCSILVGTENSMFTNYLDYYDTIDGLKIYKVDNYLKAQYSNYEKQKERAKIKYNRENLR